MSPFVEPSAFTRLANPDLDECFFEKGYFFFGDPCCGKRRRWVFCSSKEAVDPKKLKAPIWLICGELFQVHKKSPTCMALDTEGSQGQAVPFVSRTLDTEGTDDQSL